MLGLANKVKRALLRSIVWLIYYSGALRLSKDFINRFQLIRRVGQTRPWPVLLRVNVRNVQILTYHRVNDEADPFFPGVPIRVFTEQMDYLAHSYNILSLDDAVARLVHRDVPENAVAITFDDGYRDNYVNAFPILQRLSIPATIFLATDAINGNTSLWHDRVFTAFRETQQKELRGYLPGVGTSVYPLKTVLDKLAAQRRVLAYLRTLGGGDRDHWIGRLVEQLGVDEERQRPGLMLSWSEVREMQGQGIRFGSHTMSHPVLSTLTPERMCWEISGSKKVIEDQLGIDVSAFAYPNGNQADFTQATKNILRECGYCCAVTTIFGTNGGCQDVYELRRGGPWETHLPTFAVKLGWYKFFSDSESL
jgi:peptidoglycan/xylan/chitin deacetylase (PgdA/CDA1 family)